MKIAYDPQLHYVGNNNYICITTQFLSVGQALFRMSVMAWDNYSKKVQRVLEDICHEYGFSYVGVLQIGAICRDWGYDMRIPVPASELLTLSTERATEFTDRLKMACVNVEMYCTFDLKEAEQ